MRTLNLSRFIVKEHINNVLSETLLHDQQLHTWYFRNKVYFCHGIIVKCHIFGKLVL